LDYCIEELYLVPCSQTDTTLAATGGSDDREDFSGRSIMVIGLLRLFLFIFYF
jgi:hypothetical protein